MCIRDSVTVETTNGSEQPTLTKEVYPQKEADGDLYHLSLIHIFTDMEGTELYEKMMEGSSEIGIRIKGLIAVSYTHLDVYKRQV